MLIEQVYPLQQLIVPDAHVRPVPKKGDHVEIQGDPEKPTIFGDIIGSLEDPMGKFTKIFIDADEAQEGAQEVAEWLQMSCEVGIMVVEKQNET